MSLSPWSAQMWSRPFSLRAKGRHRCTLVADAGSPAACMHSACQVGQGDGAMCKATALLLPGMSKLIRCCWRRTGAVRPESLAAAGREAPGGLHFVLLAEAFIVELLPQPPPQVPATCRAGCLHVLEGDLACIVLHVNYGRSIQQAHTLEGLQVPVACC
jgi:hypothetical protein